MNAMWNKFRDFCVPTVQNTYRPYLLRRPWLIFFFTVVLTTEGVFALSLVAQRSASDLPALVIAAEVVALTNLERSEHNAAPLEENALLSMAAQAKAEDMAELGYFAHTGPGGKEPWEWIGEAGYEYQLAGENLAVRFEESQHVVRAWMESPSHRANIVKLAYAEIGVGVAEGEFNGSRATFVVQYFGTPREVAELPIAQPFPQALSTQGNTFENDFALVPTPAPAPAPQTLGAANAAEPVILPDTNTQDDPGRLALKAVTLSGESTSFILGVVFLGLVLLTALTFFVRLEIQSHEILMGSVVVAGVALLFLVFNNSDVLHRAVQNQAAAGTGMYSGLVDGGAYQIEVFGG